jgi:SAM-dependent methyltransferase
MPTVPPPQPRPTEPHQARQIAESFGSDAERYDRARPRYPGALVERIAAASPGRAILDVGAGTGIAARQFQAAGCRVLGVEPDARMADFARLSGLATEVAKFEDWDPAGRKFDAVIAGMAWHWVDPVTGAAKAARVLRPGGRLAPFWYVFQPPSDLVEAFAAVYRRVLPDSPVSRGTMPSLDQYSVIFDKAADGMRQAGAFGDPEQWRFDWDRLTTRNEWLELVPTFGGHNQFPPGKPEELLAGIGAAVDAAGGSFTMHYTAVVVTAVLKSVPLPFRVGEFVPRGEDGGQFCGGTVNGAEIKLREQRAQGLHGAGLATQCPPCSLNRAGTMPQPAARVGGRGRRHRSGHQHRRRPRCS